MSTLIFIPGLASNGVMWRNQLAAVPPQFQVHVSNVHFCHASIEAMAQGLLDAHPGDLLLCGASMGGIVAMEVVRLAPHRVKGLALLGTNARPEAPEMRTLRENAIKLFEQGRAKEVLRANAPLAFHRSRAQDTSLIQTYLDFVLAAGTDQLIQQNRAIMGRPDARLHLSNLTCPTLILCGDSDRLTPPELSQEMADLIPHARFVQIETCGHMLTMEQPQAVNAELLRWLNDA